MLLPEDKTDSMGRKIGKYRRKYSDEQYALAEMMLTHGFSITQTARVTRMPESTITTLSRGDIMFEIELHMWSEEEEE